MNKKREFNPKYLQIADKEDVQYVLSAIECKNQAKQIRANHAEYRKGMTKDKSMRFVARIPISMMFDKEYSKYFDKYQDSHEFKKSMNKLLSKYPAFKTVDVL